MVKANPQRQAASLCVVAANESDVSPVQERNLDRFRREGLAVSTPLSPLG
ncbi:hypothetical protein BIWAKO_06539 [Bosea sp. BIWAKO-01]|jgi:hypothetical protein|nr:hypothetical protein BIWAKO_06539 [Bosea sp. BIWAKO-01]